VTIVAHLRQVALRDQNFHVRSEAAEQLQRLVLDLDVYSELFPLSLTGLRDVGLWGFDGSRGLATWLLFDAARSLSWVDARGGACVLALASIARHHSSEGALAEVMNKDPKALPDECVDFLAVEMTRPTWSHVQHQAVVTPFDVDVRASVPCTDALRRRVPA